jgi:hypothetical protein
VRRIAALLLALAVTMLLPRAGRAEGPGGGGERDLEGPPAGGDTVVSPEGHPFRVRFDPASRIWLGMSYALGRGADGAWAHLPEVDLGLSYRGRYASGVGRGRIVWQVDHRVLAGWVTPFSRPIAGVPGLDAAAYATSLLRHDELPSVVLPLSPPVGVPFPFDIGFEGEVGRVSIPPSPPARVGGGEAPVVRTGVLRASVVLDPWRSGEPGRSLELGIGARYDVDAYPAAGSGGGGGASAGGTAVVHRVAPMTAGSLRLRAQSDDGLWALDCRGDFVPHWTSEDRWRVMVLSAAHAERTLAAINDEPIVAVLEGGYRLLPATAEVEALHDVRVSLGLTMNLALQ